MLDAYLDIETTGLSWLDSEITVIGLYLVNSDASRLVQFVGREITNDNIICALKNVQTIFTYNGSRFDIPFINAVLGTDLDRMINHHDLMYDCWSCNLYGGFKVVEQQLGITRELQGISGLDAIELWWRYRNDGDQDALNLLLKYNEEDVKNLRVLRERLGGKQI